MAAMLLRAAGRLLHNDAALNTSVTGWEAVVARFKRACLLLLLPDRATEGAKELAAFGCPVPGTP